MSIFSSYPAVGHTDDGKPDGTVLMYAGSHRFPTPTDDDDWLVDLAVIPAWCVPGHADAEESSDVGEYVRLSIGNEDAILTEASARKLRDQLDHWLSIPKRKAVTDG